MKKTYRTTGGSGALRWFFHRITSIYLAVVLLVHFFMMHFAKSADTRLTYEGVKNFVSNPYFKTMDILFLFFALYHGLYGLWGILEDYVHSYFWRGLIFTVLVLLGFALVVLGTITLIKF